MKTVLFVNNLRVPTSGYTESQALDAVSRLTHIEHLNGFDQGGNAKAPRASQAEVLAAVAAGFAELN